MIYELTNKDLTIQINSLGAELISCKNKEGFEFIHQPHECWVGQAKNLFPSIGQTMDNYILVDGKKYKAKQHGFAKDMEFQLVASDETFLSFMLEANEETKQYLPYEFRLYIEFFLNGNELKQNYKVVNCENSVIYFAVGSHTGFTTDENSYLDMGTNGSLTEIERKDMMFLTGKCENYLVKNGEILLTKESYNDGADILTGFNEKVITLRNKKSERAVSVDFTGFQYMALWAPSNSDIAISIMPWCGLPDAQDRTGNFEEKQGNVRLEKNGEFAVYQIIKFM